ncbi:hypothetical protein GQ457_05G032880 [Hibiscus cannabinus]
MESNKFALLFLALVLAVAAPSVTAARNQVTPFSIIADADADAKNPLANVFFDYCYPKGHACGFDNTCCTGKCTKFPFAAAGFCT